MNVAVGTSSPLLQRVIRVLEADASIASIGRDVADPKVLIAYADDPAVSTTSALVVTPDETSPQPSIVRCAPLGLADALVSVIGGTLVDVAWATPGTPRGPESVQFPPPIGTRQGTRLSPTHVRASSGSTLGALMVSIDRGTAVETYGIVDNAEFMAAACWAAGASVAAGLTTTTDRAETNEIAQPTTEPVDHAEQYIAACQAAGLVIAKLARD